MSEIIFFAGRPFQSLRRRYTQSMPRLDDDLYRRAQSVAISLDVGRQIHWFEGDNYAGAGVLIVRGGVVENLATTPWGDWANRIASVRFVDGNPSMDESRKAYPDVQLYLGGDGIQELPPGAIAPPQNLSTLSTADGLAISVTLVNFSSFRRYCGVWDAWGGGSWILQSWMDPWAAVPRSINTSEAGYGQLYWKALVNPGEWNQHPYTVSSLIGNGETINL